MQRCVELKEALNSAMISLNMETLTAYEWLVCQELCIVLGPCKEVTKELSGEKYITGSLVIPITIGLTKALENLGMTNNFMPAVDRVRQDLIGGLKIRFANLTKSKTYTNCMFLDRRFKLYFEDNNSAGEVKRRIIATVVQELNKTDTNENINIIQHTSSIFANPYGLAIWVDYDNKMKNIQPDGTNQSRAIVEVQRYLDDKIINRQECPMNWWREHRAAYPHLYKIAAQKLNAKASSVPCERVFSAADNMLNERRARLGIRKLQQLVFLNQNL